MKKSIIFTAIAFGIVFITSCSKEDLKNTNPKVTFKISKASQIIGDCEQNFDVYLTGFIGSADIAVNGTCTKPYPQFEKENMQSKFSFQTNRDGYVGTFPIVYYQQNTVLLNGKNVDFTIEK